MSDKLVFDLAQEIEGSPNVFVKKDWLNILDNQNGSYSSNQSVIDTSQLSNSNKYMSYREAYLLMPITLTVGTVAQASAGAFDPATAGSSADYLVGMKNWFGSMIHSITMDYNGTTIIQQTPFCNMWNSFKLMTSLSWADVRTQGSMIGFYPDTPDSWTFSNVASGLGIGVGNNTNYSATGSSIITNGAFNAYRCATGNLGFLNRQSFINFDADGVVGTTTYASFLTAQSASTLYQSYISRKVDGVNGGAQGVLQISINAQIYLKHLHSFFMMCPLLKGAFLKLTLNLNNTTAEIPVSNGATDTLGLTSVSNAVGGVCPFMVSATTTGNGGNGVFSADTTIRVNASVGSTCLDSTLTSVAGNSVGQGAYRNLFLYVPAYTFNPVFESAYLSSPIKQIKYTDIYQYQITNVASQGQINSLLTNGISAMKSVLLVPFYTATTLGLPCPEYQSPYDPAGCGQTAPMVQLTNFNVVVSGQNMLYNTQRYSFEEFSQQLYGQNAVNGGMTDGLTSGLVDFYAFKHTNCFYYVDVSRMLPVEESVPKSVQIIGQNITARPIDLWCFIEYGVDVSVDILTGARV
jgi:hypothetical protein